MSVRLRDSARESKLELALAALSLAVLILLLIPVDFRIGERTVSMSLGPNTNEGRLACLLALIVFAICAARLLRDWTAPSIVLVAMVFLLPIGTIGIADLWTDLSGAGGGDTVCPQDPEDYFESDLYGQLSDKEGALGGCVRLATFNPVPAAWWTLLALTALMPVAFVWRGSWRGRWGWVGAVATGFVVAALTVVVSVIAALQHLE
jgi:hypothetical protein